MMSTLNYWNMLPSTDHRTYMGTSASNMQALPPVIAGNLNKSVREQLESMDVSAVEFQGTDTRFHDPIASKDLQIIKASVLDIFDQSRLNSGNVSSIGFSLIDSTVTAEQSPMVYLL